MPAEFQGLVQRYKSRRVRSTLAMLQKRTIPFFLCPKHRLCWSSRFLPKAAPFVPASSGQELFSLDALSFPGTVLVPLYYHRLPLPSSSEELGEKAPEF